MQFIAAHLTLWVVSILLSFLVAYEVIQLRKDKKATLQSQVAAACCLVGIVGGSVFAISSFIFKIVN